MPKSGIAIWTQTRCRVDWIRANLKGMETFTFHCLLDLLDTRPGVKIFYQVRVKVIKKERSCFSSVIFAIADSHFWWGNLLFLCLWKKEPYQSRIEKPQVHEYPLLNQIMAYITPLLYHHHHHHQHHPVYFHFTPYHMIYTQHISHDKSAPCSSSTAMNGKSNVPWFSHVQNR